MWTCRGWGAGRKMRRLAILFVLLMALPAWAVTGVYYVDTAGLGGTPSDSYTTTQAQNITTPWLTIDHARTAIAGTTGNTVYLRGGTYYQTSTLMFTYADNGAAGLPNVYRAYGSEVPIISGGKVLTGTWVQSGNIWHMNNVDAAHGYQDDFRSLFVDGVRATRARSPNKLPDTSKLDYYIVAADGTTGTLKFSGTDISDAWTNPTLVEICYVVEYQVARERIASVNAGTHTATFAGTLDNASIATNRYWIENCYEALDTPGEWYLNTVTHVLYYYPLASTPNPNSSEIIYPALGYTSGNFYGSLLTIHGTATSPYTYAQYLSFIGLTFDHVDWYLSDFGFPGYASEISQYEPGPLGTRPMVGLVGAQYCTFDHCIFKHCGGDALGLVANHVTATYDTFTDVGANAVMAGEIDYSLPTLDGYHTITDNTITFIGTVYPACAGVYTLLSGYNTISHNLIHDVPFMGIWCGNIDYDSTKHIYNTIQYNHIYDALNMLEDGACLYVNGPQLNTQVSYNKVHDCNGIYSSIYPYTIPGGLGLYIDDTGHNVTMTNNWVYRVHRGFLLNSNSGNTISNNVFYGTASTWLHDTGAITNTVTKNISVMTVECYDGFWYHLNVPSIFMSGNAMPLSDYNLFYNTGTHTVWDAHLAKWQLDGGDPHSITGNPLFVAGTDNYELQSISPALVAQPTGIGFTNITKAVMDTVGPRAETTAKYILMRKP